MKKILFELKEEFGEYYKIAIIYKISIYSLMAFIVYLFMLEKMLWGFLTTLLTAIIQLIANIKMNLQKGLRKTTFNRYIEYPVSFILALTIAITMKFVYSISLYFILTLLAITTTVFVIDELKE